MRYVVFMVVNYVNLRYRVFVLFVRKMVEICSDIGIICMFNSVGWFLLLFKYCNVFGWGNKFFLMVYFGFEVYVKLKGICIEYIYVWVGDEIVLVFIFVIFVSYLWVENI